MVGSGRSRVKAGADQHFAPERRCTWASCSNASTCGARAVLPRFGTRVGVPNNPSRLPSRHPRLGMALRHEQQGFWTRRAGWPLRGSGSRRRPAPSRTGSLIAARVELTSRPRPPLPTRHSAATRPRDARINSNPTSPPSEWPTNTGRLTRARPRNRPTNRRSPRRRPQPGHRAVEAGQGRCVTARDAASRGRTAAQSAGSLRAHGAGPAPNLSQRTGPAPLVDGHEPFQINAISCPLIITIWPRRGRSSGPAPTGHPIRRAARRL